MHSQKYGDIALAGNADLPLWELFHENSKLSRYSSSLSDAEVLEYLGELQESLQYTSFPATVLPRGLMPMKKSFPEIILSRQSIREMLALPLKLREIGTLLRLSYGVTRRRAFSGVARSLRVVPSGGALYPLEIFIHVNKAERLQTGVYHYNPVRHDVRLLQHDDPAAKLKKCFIQESIYQCASLLIFITAIFERSVLKYGERGYRFAFLEAGHVAQNINLVSCAMGLACFNVGGFFDREVDAFLNLDGITHSTVYVVAIGRCHNAQARSQKRNG
jgi:SagB-type dehydrogenase family enzyme